MTLLTPLPSPQEQLALEPKRSIDEGNDGDHLVFLYKENNLAKLIGVAQAYLENNVSGTQNLRVYQLIDFHRRRIHRLDSQRLFHREVPVAEYTNAGMQSSGHAAFSQAASTASWKD